MTEIVFQVEEDPIDGGWVARAIGASIVTQADTIDELKTIVRDALQCHYDNEEDIPPVTRLHFVRDVVFNFAM